MKAVACCVHAANRFGTKPGDKVAVIGCGFMGMALMEQGHIITEPLVTVYDFEETERAFRELANGKSGLFKAALLMRV